MKVLKTAFLLIISCLLIAPSAFAQNESDKVKNSIAPMRTAVPSLSIAPDARGGGMGDNGVSTTPDISSQYWNPAKYAFQYSQAGVSLSYTPWLRKLVNDVALVYLSGFYKLGQDDLQAVGSSIRYFTLGEVTTRPQTGDAMILNPYEMAFDVSYSRKLSDIFSMGVALRYIRSDMGSRTDDLMEPANAFAADVAGYLENYVVMGNSECLWSFGFNISNLGTKVTYDGGETHQFLPAMLKIGTGLLFPIDDYNKMGLYVDVSKHLVPTYPQQYSTTDDDIVDYEKRLEDYNSMSSLTGVFKSFNDSPNGFSGELKEIMFSLGAEYSYNDQFFVRGGYYYENENLGNRQYFSLGAGFRMSVFQLDAAYLISTVQSNPLDQTLRFSLSFDMDGLKSLFR